MTEQPAATTVEAPAPPAQPTAPIPGRPEQTAAAVETFVKSPEILAHINKEVDKRLGRVPGVEPQSPAAQGVSAADFEALKMALKYKFTEDQLPLIADTTPEGVRARAELLAAQPKPEAAAPAPVSPAPTETPKAAGVPLPAPTVASSAIPPGGLRAALIANAMENPVPPPKS